MIELTIEGKEFDVAETWDEITFSQFINIVKLNEKKEENPLLKAIKIIAALSNKPEECETQLLIIPNNEFEGLASNFEWTSHDITEFKTDKEFLEIEGKRYKIKKNNNKLTIGEMISIENSIKFNPNLSQYEIAFGVLLREVGPDDKEMDFNEDNFYYIISNLKDKVMLMDIYNVISFFLSGAKIPMQDTKAFSVQKKKMNHSTME